jgi:hypothetical protein
MKVLFDDRISKLQLGVDAVHVAPPLAAPLHVARVFEVSQNSVRVPLGDVCDRRNFADAKLGLLSDGEQHLRVVRGEPQITPFHNCGRRARARLPSARNRRPQP